MPFIRLCQTREVLPQEIEHFLNLNQNQIHRWAWTSKELHVENAGTLFTGARLVPGNKSTQPLPYFLNQSQGPLLPIKRFRQFEDPVNRLRHYPSDALLNHLETGQLQIHAKPLPSKQQAKIRRKAQSSFFDLSRNWDRFESKTWFKLRIRNLIGALYRRCRGPLIIRTPDSKQSTGHDREGPIEAVLDKLSRPLFKVQIRSSKPIPQFSQAFRLAHLGELKWQSKPAELILSSEELATLMSLPSPELIRSQLNSEPCAWLPGKLELSVQDRLKHLHIIGKTGMGKSTAILELFKKDLQKFPQLMIMDPHGDLIERALSLIPPSRQKDVILLDPSQREHPLALNPLESQGEKQIELQASSLLEMFFALSKGSWGPRLEYLLRNTLLTLLKCPNTTLLDIPRLLTNTKIVHHFAQQCNDIELQRFWVEEFLSLESRQRNEMISPALNKVGPLLSSSLLRNIFGQPKAKFNFDQILESPCIILVPLSKSLLGEDASRLLGMSFISMLHGSLLRRKHRHPLSLTLDEFQNFATPTLMTMLSESRKFGLALSLAHQYLKQVPENILDAIMGNVGSHLVLRSAYEDSETLAPIMNLEIEDLANLPELNAYFKGLKSGQPQSSVRIELQATAMQPQLFRCKRQFGRPRALVEAKLKARYTKRKIYTRQ